MRIISQYKDYYDYMKGILGEDEKFVYDRREYHGIPYMGSDYIKETFFIGDYKVHGVWMKGRLLFGDEIKPYAEKEDNVPNWRYSHQHPKEDYYLIKWGRNNYFHYLKHPIKMENSPTYDMDCPVLILVSQVLVKDQNKPFMKNPILKDYGLQKVFDAKEIWLIISEWFGKNITKKEPSVPIGDDNIRIQSHGFDLKTSFRPKLRK